MEILVYSEIHMNMCLHSEEGHNILMQSHGNYNKAKFFNFHLKLRSIVILQRSALVIFLSFQM